MADRQSHNTPPGKGPSPGGGPPRGGLFSRNPFLIILLILAGIFLINQAFGSAGQVKIKYGTFWSYLEGMPDAKVDPETGAPQEDTASDGPGIIEVTLIPRKAHGWLRPRPAENEDSPEKLWQAHINDKGLVPFVTEISVEDRDLLPMLRKKGVKFGSEIPTDWTSLLVWGLPILFLMFILMMMFRSSRMTGENVLSFGRSRAKIVSEDKTGVTFEDVAGADEAKEELSEIVEFLKEPDRFTALGGKIPKGCLLVGPPGCGKTLLSRAVAGEAGVPFFSISGSDFVEMFVGVGAARVRDLFNTAKQKAPCIVFVDEIDAVGRHRGTGLGGGHDEREQTLNQLLVEMDGFDGRKGVIVIAATNRPDILDPALLRPGRFDRHVVLDAPDLKGREAILGIHARDKPLASDVDLEVVAQRTPGFTGADLANVMNEAALLAARRNKSDIGMKEVEEAIERVVAGPERRSRIISPEEKRILAYHELGHALVARYSPGADSVHKVSIIPRGRGALGYTLTLPTEDRYIITKDELLARIRVFLGGRTAEEVIFGQQSTGAEDDLQKVSQLARSLVCRWGMTDDLGPVAYDRAPGSPFLGRDMGHPDQVSESTSSEIDRSVRQIIDRCHEEAREILEANRTLLDELAGHLIENEVLGQQEFEEMVQKYATHPPPERALRAQLLAEDGAVTVIETAPAPEPTPETPPRPAPFSRPPQPDPGPA